MSAMEIIVTDHARRRAMDRLGGELDLGAFTPTRLGTDGRRLWTRPDGVGVLVAEAEDTFTIVTVLTVAMVARTPSVRIPGKRPKLPRPPAPPTIDAVARWRSLDTPARTAILDTASSRLRTRAVGLTVKALARVARIDHDLALAVLVDLESDGVAVREGDRWLPVLEPPSTVLR